jgi:hypothetical protein
MGTNFLKCALVCEVQTVQFAISIKFILLFVASECYITTDT